MRVWSSVDGRWCEGEAATGAIRWYDLTRADEAALRDLAARYNLHPLSVDDCLSPYLHTPKVEEFAEHLFLVMVAIAPGEAPLDAEELDVFLGRDFIITYHDRAEAPPAIESVVTAIKQGVTLRPGTDGLLYEIADRNVESFFPRVTDLAERLDEIEDQILVQGRFREDQRKVLALRALAGRFRRLMAPELQYMLRFGRGEFEVVHEGNRPYFRDIYDHLLRVDLALEELREDTEVALSSYLSVLNNRLNEVMKVLAIVSALALPGTVITGVFGTNFDNVPGLHSNWGFALMIASIVGVAAGMAMFFKRRGWF